MKALLAASAILAVTFARDALASTSAHPTEEPRGACHVAGPGLSLVIEDTTTQACREHQRQCESDNPGREATCHSSWTTGDHKKNKTRKSEEQN